MAEHKKDTRAEIIKAARDEFLRAGYDGARLQGIADHIGVTKAMIHYYFNTKKELFEHVYRQTINQLFGSLSETLNQDIPLFQKIDELVDFSLDTADQHGDELTFVITESNRKTDWLIPLLEDEVEVELSKLNNELEESASNYEIASVSASQLLLNILSLSYYPALSQSVNASLLNIEADDIAAEHRKGIVIDTILNWLTA